MRKIKILYLLILVFCVINVLPQYKSVNSANTMIYSGSFTSLSNYNYTTSLKTISCSSGKQWSATVSGVYSNKLRIGNSSNNSLDNKFKYGTVTSGAVLYMSGWTIDNATSVELTASQAGGTVSKIAILQSSDSGENYALAAEKDYSTSLTFDLTPNTKITLAIVISGTTPRLDVTSIKFYSDDSKLVPIATFKNGDNTFHTSTISNGQVVDKPTTPTQEGKVFVGWSKTGNAADLFDLDSQDNTSSITLYAVFRDYYAVELFENLSTSANMKFNYINYNDVIYSDILGNNINTNSSADALKTFADGDNATSYVFGSRTDVTLTCTNAGKADGTKARIWGKSDSADLRLYENSVFTLSSTKGIKKLIIKYSGANRPTVVCNLKSLTPTSQANNRVLYTVPESDYNNSIIISRGDNNVTILSITIVCVSEKEGFKIIDDTAFLRFGTTIQKTLVDQIANENTGKSIIYGIEYTVEDYTGTQVFSFDNESDDPLIASVASLDALDSDPDGDYYQFAIVIPIPKEKYKTIIKARVYVEIDSIKYYMEEKEYSFISIAEEYFDIGTNTYELLEVLYYIATELGGTE